MRSAVLVPCRAISFVAVLLAAGLALAQPGLEDLTVVTADGEVHAFEVEVARTDAERGRGLMFRRDLDPSRGMLFDFTGQHGAAMWMKDTFIPLDMLFIAEDGRVVHIEHDAAPHSLRVRSAGRPVAGVLELLGGTARALGIGIGDRVRHPLFGGGASD